MNQLTRSYNFYVSAKGDDAWSGELPAPNDAHTDGPFATLVQARDAIRQIKIEGRFDRPVNVLVLGGTLYLDQPLILESTDSGTAEHPVTFAAFPGHAPVISGGIELNEWETYKGRIVKCQLPKVQEDGWFFRQLFFKGDRQIRARWPKRDPDDPLYAGWAFIESTEPEGQEYPTTFHYESPEPPRQWSKPAMAEVNIFPWYCWLNDIIPVSGIDPSTQTLTLARLPHHAKHQLMSGNRFIVENVLEELDEPGEWCLDPETRTVYFWPPTDSLAPGDVAVPLADRLIELRGTEARPITHIVIRGLTFAHTRSPFPEYQHAKTFHSPGWRGGTVHLENAEHCRVEQNLFRAVGADAVRLDGYNAHHHIIRNEIAYPGATGIAVTSNGPQGAVTWTDKQVLDDRASQYAMFVRNKISNNHIHHGGAIKKRCGAVQIFAMKSVDNVISHNLIHDMSDKAIMIKDGFGRVLVEYNEMFRLGLEVTDTAAIMTESWFTLDDDNDLCHGNVIRFNRIRDVFGCGAYGKPMAAEWVQATRAGGKIWMPYFTWGIYFDNSGENITVFGNIVSGTVLGGVSLPVGNPKNIVIENNILFGHHLHQTDLQIGGGMTKGQGACGNRFVRNIVICNDPKSALLGISDKTKDAFAECNHNLYFPGDGQEPSIAGAPDRSYEKWRQLGFDANSVIADPCFVEVAAGDFRLQPQSPAFELGFAAIDQDAIGLQCIAGLPDGRVP